MNNIEQEKASIRVGKKILFYVNASSQKLIYDLDVKQNLTDAQTRLGAFIIIYIFEFSCILFIDRYLLGLSEPIFKFVLLLPIFFHGLINLFFSKDLNQIVNDYYSFYSKTQLYIFYTLPLFGIAFLILLYL